MKHNWTIDETTEPAEQLDWTDLIPVLMQIL